MADQGPYGTPSYSARAPHELIVRAQPEARLTVRRDGRIEGKKAASLGAALKEAGATLWPLLDDPRRPLVAIVLALPQRVDGASLFGKTLETVLAERPCRVIIESTPSPDGHVRRQRALQQASAP